MNYFIVILTMSCKCTRNIYLIFSFFYNYMMLFKYKVEKQHYYQYWHMVRQLKLCQQLV
jgi:hypothetical protein